MLPTVDESAALLQRAGWSVGETAGGAGWLVTGRNGENMISAWAASQSEAWWRAVQQAEAVGLAGLMSFRMLLVGLAGLALAWSGSWAGEPELTQDQVIDQIKKLGGRVHVLEQQLGKPVAGVWSLNRFTDRDVPLLRGFATLIVLDLGGSQVTDKGLARLKGLTSLEHLDLRETPVTDKGLRMLKGFTALRLLDLTKTKVTDAGVKELQKARPELEIVR
jgi:hypothetical protein